MQLYMTDKAIEFKSEYEKLERVFDALKDAHIDASTERKQAAELKTKIEYNVLNMIDPIEIESTYAEGVKGLAKINESLKKYEVYYIAYNSACYVERQMGGKEVNDVELKTYAKVTIGLLKQINSSNTMSLQSEEQIVNKLYDLAYNIIKVELLTLGKSEVLDWAKTDRIAGNLIETRIFKDIASVPQDSTLYSEIRNILASINAQNTDNANAISSGIKYTALDEGLILFLSLQDSQNIEKIEASLYKMINELLQSEKDMQKQKTDNNEHELGIEESKERSKEIKIRKNIIGIIVMLSSYVASFFMLKQVAKDIGNDEYKTKVEYYSSQEMAMPEYPEYMEKIKNGSQTTLKAYDTWHRENIFYGDYERQVVVFNLDDLNLTNLEDYASIDFSKLEPESGETETASELDPSMIYDEAIVEITRLIQDPNDTVFVPNEESQKAFITICSIINSVVAGVFVTSSIITLIQKIKQKLTEGSLRKSELISLADGLIRYKQLCAENEEFKSRFIKAYEKYARIIKDEDLKKECERILKKIEA